jgi:hypothetical protein
LNLGGEDGELGDALVEGEDKLALVVTVVDL